MNLRLLKSRMIEHDVSRDDLCKALNINPSTWWRKVHNNFNFNLAEIKTICEVLHLTNVERDLIFFEDDRA